MLFCDLVGFTAFSEARDHEDVRDVLEEYFAAARRIVAAYEGTIEKFIGDAVMAVWGAPVAHEDDAERAVRAALDLTTAVAALADRLAIAELAVRVGVLTGEAAVDVGGASQGMVIGDAVNTAARIQIAGRPRHRARRRDDAPGGGAGDRLRGPRGAHAVKGRDAARPGMAGAARPRRCRLGPTGRSSRRSWGGPATLAADQGPAGLRARARRAARSW